MVEEREWIMKKDNMRLVITGSPASPGKASGEVKVVFNHIEAEKRVGDNDVLITPMTNPDYTSSILKASAIVTNFGDILCHAAIISRELGKPCVIGTKKATEVLKEGQKILVDGSIGKVYLLEDE